MLFFSLPITLISVALNEEYVESRAKKARRAMAACQRHKHRLLERHQHQQQRTSQPINEDDSSQPFSLNIPNANIAPYGSSCNSSTFHNHTDPSVQSSIDNQDHQKHPEEPLSSEPQTPQKPRHHHRNHHHQYHHHAHFSPLHLFHRLKKVPSSLRTQSSQHFDSTLSDQNEPPHDNSENSSNPFSSSSHSTLIRSSHGPSQSSLPRQRQQMSHSFFPLSEIDQMRLFETISDMTVMTKTLDYELNIMKLKLQHLDHLKFNLEECSKNLEKMIHKSNLSS